MSTRAAEDVPASGGLASCILGSETVRFGAAGATGNRGGGNARKEGVKAEPPNPCGNSPPGFALPLSCEVISQDWRKTTNCVIPFI